MKVGVVCANGKAGKLIVKEAVERGLDVTAIVRGDNQSVADKVITRDLFDLTADDLKEFDVIVDAFGAWTEDVLPKHSTSLKHLCDALSGSQTRLMVVGGAGSLYVNKEHTAQVADGPDFPAEGEKTGEYILAGEELTLNEKGESIISYADYAVAMVDEITKGNHIQERISVVRK